MRILHTADWHLGDRLGRIDRTDDLRIAVERIADYCRSEAVDVLLVAGDLFSEQARPEGLRETIRHWSEVFRAFLERGGTILAITGNHDNESFCRTLVNAMSLAAPTVGRMGETVPPGRLYLAAEPTFVKLVDRVSGRPVQFVLMPYPTPGRYLKGDGALHYGSPQEKTNLLVAAWAETLRGLRADERYDPDAPAVLVAHVHLHGTHAGTSLFRMAPEDDVVVEGAELPQQFDYVALGHIHKPQVVGEPHVRYCGSIERMDLGESTDQKGCVLVEIGADGLVGEPSVLVLPAAAMYDVMVRNPATEIAGLKQQYPSAETALVKLNIRYTAGTHQLEEVLRELDGVFPRWYARDWQETGALGPSLTAAESGPSRSFAETVRDYLATELIQHTEGERDAILTIAEGLMKEISE
jgi:DNA repair protein SbcD/Mre11